MINDYAHMDTGDLLVAVNQATNEMLEKNIQVIMTMDIMDMLAAVGAIQLALRHPALPTITAQMLIRLIRQVTKELHEYPALVELVHRGGNADYDVTGEEAHAFRLVRSSGPGQGQE